MHTTYTQSHVIPLQQIPYLPSNSQSLHLFSPHIPCTATIGGEYNYLYIIILMDIGSAIAVFLVLSIVMLALFCFVTKYFHYKLKRTIEENNEVYSMVDEVYQNSEEDGDGEYEEFKEKAGSAKPKRDNKKKDDEMYIEMNDLKTPLKNQDNIYQAGQLRQKLNGSAFQMISKQESSRQISELKSFRPEKLNTTNRTNRTNNDRSGPSTHTFIHKLVSYSAEGLTVCDILVKMIRKVSEGVVKESKTCRVQTYSTSQQNFDDQLEIMGFEKHFYGCYKYETSVDVSNMKTDENYLVKSLKTSERKEQITEEEYQKYRNQLVVNAVANSIINPSE